MNVQQLLSKASSLLAPQQRRVATILGAVVADAAAQPIHWIYDEEEMTKVLSEAPHGNPEFITPSKNPFYCLPTGSPSMYGDELMVTLESLVASKGFDEADYRKRCYDAFGPGSEYDNPISASITKSDFDWSMLPIKAKWLNKQVRHFVLCHSEGKTLEDVEDEDMGSPDSIPRLIPFVALYAGRDNFVEMAGKAVSVFQSYDMSNTVILGALRLIEQYMLYGGTRENLVEAVIKELKSPDRALPQPLDRAMAGHLQAVLDKKDLSVFEATNEFGKT